MLAHRFDEIANADRSSHPQPTPGIFAGMREILGLVDVLDGNEALQSE
jgi:hypothetical protein